MYRIKMYLPYMAILSALFICGCNLEKTGDSENIQNELATIEVINDYDSNIVKDENVEQLILISQSQAEINENINEETEENMEVSTMDTSFYIEEISDDLFDRIYGKSFKEDCTVNREDLRYLHICHIGFDGESHEGELIVNEKIAQTILDIFKELYDEQYQIEKVRLVDEYDADDEKSMADNNSSAFNFRFISYTTTVSKHGKGLAIDINPLYNPYVKIVNGEESIEPANSKEYVDRCRDFEHKIDENDLAYKLFTEAGFTWGGNWNSSKDYQHFEMN